MWLLLATVLASVVIVIVTRGSFAELTHLRIGAVWLLFLGVAIQVALEFVDFPKDQIETIGYGVLMVSYALILAFCLSNLIVRGFAIITIGVALNAIVIGLNQGMPTEPVGEDAQGHRIQKPIEQTVKHRPESDDDLLPFLGDQIVLPEPFDTVISVGDIVILVGVCELAYFGSRRRRRRGRNSRRERSTSRPSSTR